MRKFIVIFFNALKSLSIKKIANILLMGLSHPLFSILYFYASFKAFSIAKKLYPKTNSSNGRGNAFRHSFWCCMIMMYYCKVSSPAKSLIWCEKFTNMHEDLFPNKPLENKMDLHNNKVGMSYFMTLLEGTHRQFFESSFFIPDLQKMTNEAVVLKEVNQDLNPNILVYLED